MFNTIREFLFGKKSTPVAVPEAPYKIETLAVQEKPVEEVPVVTAPAPVAAPSAAPVMTPARKKPAAKPIAKPAAKPAAKPIAKPAAKPARKKPVAK
jgi:hypothetical protein